MGSLEFARKLLNDAQGGGVARASASASYGDDHVRFALIENEHRIKQAVRGISEMFRKDGVLPKAAA